MLFAIGNGMVWAAYMAIPALIIYRMRRRYRVGLSAWDYTGILFSAFIALCGLGHLFEVASIWRPHYWHLGIWHCVTGVVSWATVWHLWRRRQRIVLQSDFDDILKQRDEALSALAELRQHLKGE